jgi:hypothetical protein
MFIVQIIRLYLVDPNVEDIWINGDDGSQTQYKYGLKYGGKDKFTRETFMALDKDHEHKESGDKIDFLANKSIHNIQIKRGEETITNTIDLKGTNEGLSLSADISFNPTEGLSSEKDPTQVLSPAIGLFHELGHVIDVLRKDNEYGENLGDFNNRINTKDDDWKNCEEYYNIKYNEHPLAKFFNEYQREKYSEGVNEVTVEDVLSTKSSTKKIITK